MNIAGNFFLYYREVHHQMPKKVQEKCFKWTYREEDMALTKFQYISYGEAV